MRGRRALNRYLKSLEVDLIETIGEMNVKKELLIKQVVRAEGTMRLIELYLQKAGIMKPGELKHGRLDLQNCLSTSYIAFMNVQRQALLALGLEAKPKGEPTLAEIIREHDEAQVKRAQAEEPVGGVGDPALSEDSGGVVPGVGNVKGEENEQGKGID